MNDMSFHPMNHISTPRWIDADGFYDALLRAHANLSDEDSAQLDAQLVLLLANQVADPSVLYACLDAARAALPARQRFAAPWPALLAR